MIDRSFRDALLRQDGGMSVDAELDVLNGLVKAEGRRGRRLAFWILAVWVLWAAMALAFALSGTSEKVPERPAGAVPAPVPTFSGPQLLVSGIVGVLLVLVGFLCLPAVVNVGLIYIVVTAVAGLCFLGYSLALVRQPTPARAMRLFGFSITYLALVFVSMGVDAIVRHP